MVVKNYDNHIVTIQDIEEYFKQFKRVMRVTIREPHIKYRVDIIVLSWIPLKLSWVRDLFDYLPLGTEFHIYNCGPFKLKHYDIFITNLKGGKE